MSDREIYLNDSDPRKVAAAARHMAETAYKNGKITYEVMRSVKEATDKELFAQRNRNREKNEKTRQRLQNLRLARIAQEVGGEGRYTRAAKAHTWRPKGQ